ncbi:MAG: hypothetical protein LBU73_08165 [Helicobacteraceae bacterium]|jgi:hypothetical protein|nr:hypothetical protein [Helicobacteraceae bacterium]
MKNEEKESLKINTGATEEQTLTKEEALDFLRLYQPMPKDENLTTELIDKYDEVLRFFLQYKTKECIPLFLNSFGQINGFGVYQLVEDVILQFSMNEVIPYIKEAIKSNIYSVRYWNVQIAINYPSIEILPTLKDILNENDFDIKYNAIVAIGQFDKEIYKPILEDYLEKETEEELIIVARSFLNE